MPAVADPAGRAPLTAARVDAVVVGAGVAGLAAALELQAEGCEVVVVDPSDRRAYVTNLRQGLRPQGHVILATFAVGGPTKCSGLDVTQYDTQ